MSEESPKKILHLEENSPLSEDILDNILGGVATWSGKWVISAYSTCHEFTAKDGLDGEMTRSKYCCFCSYKGYDGILMVCNNPKNN
ncbi:hypothetical protein CLHOM_15020 [Clostridium homopropionicum DSM 5847]|uniref:Uncharacterized protein n=1 Tax=Clostridium homopropionicum DSM 5847 TaxID=1121318 RepID=A0A0L6ZAT5_9CLOT|nr:hypothetical protein [Clostridium homopropionicum]KOA20072.1 hypothetical protein CLHOM_15020 [Clostridium homopropionicum DSM 5847]SFG85880.1 hypothetical protein SAMN04488501_12022 [Clostridium homopropionicum]